jgi:hypothetical protein
MEKFGDLNTFITFLKTVYCLHVGRPNSPTLDILKAKMLEVVRREDTMGKVVCKGLMNYSMKQLVEAIKLERALPPSKARTKIIETKHNYDDNTDEYHDVHFPGAKRLKLVFDKRSATEMDCDYVYIYKDSSHTERWGGKYTGRVDGSDKNWPGVNRPPLYIDADKCCVHFHSDGSNNVRAVQFE